MIWAFFVKLGVPQRLVGPLLGVGAVLILALCVGLWFRTHDRKVVEQHEAVIARKVVEATSAANDKANANDTKRQADNARADEQIRGALADAQAKHPEAARASAGPVTSRAVNELRARQAASRTPARR